MKVRFRVSGFRFRVFPKASHVKKCGAALGSESGERVVAEKGDRIIGCVKRKGRKEDDGGKKAHDGEYHKDHQCISTATDDP